MNIGPNAFAAYEAFVSKGFPASVAAGLVGNLLQESGMKTNMGFDLNTTVDGDGGNSKYSVQWNGPRKRAFEAWAAQRNADPADVKAQVDYMLTELAGPEADAFRAIMAAGEDPSRVAAVAAEKFWRPGLPHTEARMRYARLVAEQFGNYSPTNAFDPQPYKVPEQPLDPAQIMKTGPNVMRPDMPAPAQFLSPMQDVPGGGGGEIDLDAIAAEAVRSLEGNTPPATVPFDLDAIVEQAVASVEPIQRERAGPFARAVGIMAQDLTSGLQGVNPVSMSKAEPFGALKQKPSGEWVVDVDGEEMPLAQFKPEQVVFMPDENTGTTFVYARTPEFDQQVSEGKLASIGRMLGYAVIGGPGAPLKTPKAAAPVAADVAGVTPSLSMVTPKIAAAAEQFIGTASVARRAQERTVEEIATRIVEAAAKTGPGATKFDAGNALLRGTDEFVETFKSKAATMYDAVDKLIPATTRFPMSKTADQLKAAQSLFSGTPEIARFVGADDFAKLVKEFESGVTWAAAKALRTKIGEAIGKISGPLASQSEGQLKQLYATLTEDMAAAARAAGPEAIEAWTRANTFYKAGMERITGALAQIIGKEPEKAMSNFMALAGKDGPRASLNQLRQVVQSLPPDEAKVVAAALLRTLGQAPPGAQNAVGDAFSVATFLSNWNRTSPEARAILFTKALPQGVAKEIDALVEVIEAAKKGGLDKNTSNTAGALTTLATGGALVADPVTTLLGALSANVAMRVLTSKPILRGLNRALAKGDLSMLRAISVSGEPYAVEAQTILRLLLSEEAQSTPAPSQSVPAP